MIMNKEPKKLSDLKKGDWVWTIQDGWVQVSEISPTHGYPIKVAGFSYDYSGKSHNTHQHASLYTYDPINGSEPPKPEIDWSKVPMGTWVNVDGFGSRMFTGISEGYVFFVTETGITLGERSIDKCDIDESKNPIQPEWYK